VGLDQVHLPTRRKRAPGDQRLDANAVQQAEQGLRLKLRIDAGADKAAFARQEEVARAAWRLAGAVHSGEPLLRAAAARMGKQDHNSFACK
jgi:hypothetical protein